MSTRATIHFRRGDETDAILYQHGDGYPEGLGVTIREFLQEVKTFVPDTRFNEPEYLAAKFVVYQADRMRRMWNRTHPCDFLSVGVMRTDPSDIDYRYAIDCAHFDADGYPVITYEKLDTGFSLKSLGRFPLPPLSALTA